jgi:copper oxidase (laccase) domain-containing protein
VGEEVGRQFGLSGAGCVDLASENRRQLRDAGIPESQIDVLGQCTFCDPQFHSWRRDKEQAGRMISFIRLR